jgi:hypothetical protein
MNDVKLSVRVMGGARNRGNETAEDQHLASR